MRFLSPFDLWQAGFRVAQLCFEAQAVIAMRTLGAGGVWNTPFDEGWRAWREKPDAFLEALGRATQAGMAEQGPSSVLSAAVDPLARYAGENRKRLEGRGVRKVAR